MNETNCAEGHELLHTCSSSCPVQHTCLEKSCPTEIQIHERPKKPAVSIRVCEPTVTEYMLHVSLAVMSLYPHEKSFFLYIFKAVCLKVFFTFSLSMSPLSFAHLFVLQKVSSDSLPPQTLASPSPSLYSNLFFLPLSLTSTCWS